LYFLNLIAQNYFLQMNKHFYFQLSIMYEKYLKKHILFFIKNLFLHKSFIKFFSQFQVGQRRNYHTYIINLILLKFLYVEFLTKQIILFILFYF